MADPQSSALPRALGTAGRDVSLLIKADIAMARDIAAAVDSAGVLPQAEEAVAHSRNAESLPRPLTSDIRVSRPPPERAGTGRMRRFRQLASQPSNRASRPDGAIRPVHGSTMLELEYLAMAT